ncbi:hypothetical protein VP1G_10571 [Cytospora mali]|uniref:Uncharacterized protein n=1 Tax=Cytospora mali TaxID=578113 RepID=A0A194UQ53_CYTMA|nr:hypothetical protein VP1G_10571 [Valsa mali var. pyri (nom. inval.)]
MPPNPFEGDDPNGSETRVVEDVTGIVVGMWEGSEIAGSDPNQLTGDTGTCGDPSATTGIMVVSVPLLVDVSERAAGLRPPRFDLTYSHLMPRATHFEHEGFCRWHLTLDAAHATQLSRSLGTVGAVVGRDVLEVDVSTGD